MFDSDKVSRRDALKATAGLSVVGMAGCLGDGDDVVDLNVGSSSSGSSTYGNSQAIQRIVDRESDDVNFITVDAGGDPQSIRLYADDELNAYSAGNYILNQAFNDEGPFEDEPVDEYPVHGFSHLSLNLYWLALEDSDIETTDDLFGADIYALPAGWGLRAMTEEMYGNAGLWEDLEPGVVNFETSEAASALEEGRVEAFITYTSNFTQLPAWAEEVDARNDLKQVEMTDEFVQAAQDFAGAGYDEMDDIEAAWNQDLQADAPGHSWTETYPYLFDPAVPDEAIYEVMDICHNNVADLQDANPTILDYEDPDNFTFAFTHTDQIDVHPGAADWLEDNGGWDDSWSRAD